VNNAADLSRRLAGQAEAVCSAYLPRGRRRGSYWIVGDVQGNPGQSLFVRLVGERQGYWLEYVALPVMLRCRDWALFYPRSTVSTQHNVGVPQEVS